MPNISSATTIKSVQFTEQSTTPDTPASGYLRLYASTTGSILRVIDDGGNDYQLTTGAAPADLSGQSFVVISTSSALSAERKLTGTANRITVTDDGTTAATVTLSAPQDLHTGATVQFAQANLTTSSASLHTGSIAYHSSVIATTASISSAAGFGTGSVNSSASVMVVGQYFSPLVDDGTASTDSTINWTSGNEHKLVLGATITLSFSNGVSGGRYVLLLKQDGTGSRTVTWPVSVLWPASSTPTLSTTASKTDLFTFLFDGTNYFGNYSLTF